MKDQGGYLESVEKIPAPHAFVAHVRLGEDSARYRELVVWLNPGYRVDLARHEPDRRMADNLRQTIESDGGAPTSRTRQRSVDHPSIRRERRKMMMVTRASLGHDRNKYP